ncbi:MAG: YfhO family protein [Oscillospiraceae bacterium]|nr:YfhO family protein [Oscillospiraceae bacterium]
MKEKIKKHPMIFAVLLYTLLFTAIYMVAAGGNPYMYNVASDIYDITIPQIMKLKDFYNNLFHGEFAAFDYNTVFGTEQLFSVGIPLNPFNVIVIFMPESYLVYYVKILFTVSMYMAGIGFIVMCRELEIKPGVAAAASLLYVFSPYTFTKALVFSLFTPAIACFPFVIAGMERVLRNKNGKFLAAACTLTALTCGLYMFAYQIILTVIFAFVRVILMGDAKGFFKRLWYYGLRGGLAAFTGFVLSAAALFPQMASIFASNRTSGVRENVVQKAFSPDFTGLSNIFAGGREDQCLGTVLAPLVIIFVVIKGAPAVYKLLLGLCTLGIYYPVFSAALCTFSYIEHRWAFGFILLGGYASAYVIENIRKSDLTDRILSGGGLIIYALCTDYMIAYGAVPALIIYLIIVNIPPVRRLIERFFDLINKKEKYILEVIVYLLLIMFGVIILAVNTEIYTFLTLGIVAAAITVCFIEGRGLKLRYVLGGISAAVLPFVVDKVYYEVISMEAEPYSLERLAVLEEVRDKDMASGDEIVRFESSDTAGHYNMCLTNDLASSSVFVNMFTGGFADMLKNAEFDMTSHTSLSSLKGFEHRLPFMSVWGIDYIHSEITDINYFNDVYLGVKNIPETFELVKEFTADGLDNNLYKNQYVLPFGFTYDSVIREEDRKKMNGADYGINMMYSAGLEDEYIQNEAAAPVRFEVECTVNEEITKYDELGDITYTTYTLIPNEELSDGEVYVTVNGIDVYGNKYGNITLTVNGSEDSIIGDFGGSFYGETYKWFTSQDNYTVCYSTVSGEIKTAEILLSCEFDDICLTVFPIEEYKRQFEKLSEYSLENTVLGTDEITGNITVPDERILCLQLQYDKGWSAYDNGNPTRIFPVNSCMTGLRLSPGEHDIKLVYHVPWLRAGFAVTAATIVILAASTALMKKRAVANISENSDMP